MQGFLFSVSNNEFHIPLALRYYELPQFAHDAFTQSLPRYTSAIYPLMSLVATTDNLPALFFAAHCVGRFLTLYALARIIGGLGVVSLGRCAAMLLVVLAPAAYGATAVSWQDLLPRYFTHSSLAQSFDLLAVAGLLEGRVIVACVFSAVAFDLNAFIGVWMAGPLLFASLAAAPGDWGVRLRRLGIGAALGFLVALPVLAWIVLSLKPGPLGFDFRAYLWSYFPGHFFLQAAEPGAALRLLLCIASAALALSLLAGRAGRAGRVGVAVLGGWAAVFLLGGIVGVVATSPLLFNLHLLRVDGPITLLAITATAAVAVREGWRADLPGVAAGFLIAAGLLVDGWAVVLCGLGIIHVFASGHVGPSRWMRIVGRNPALRPVFLAVLLATALIANGPLGRMAAGAVADGEDAGPHDRARAGRWAYVSDWLDVKLWIRDNTPAASVFLIPLRRNGFVSDAVRVAWVNWKAGGAVMWAPDYYRTWNERYQAVEALASSAARLRYACAHGIDYLVLERLVVGDGGTLEGLSPVFSNAGLAVYKVELQGPSCVTRP